MESAFELTTVYVTNIFGIVLIGVLLAGNLWRLRENSTENTYLLLILFFAFCGCILDPVAYTADGKPGTIARFLVYGGNTLLYLSDLFGTLFWLLFLAQHLQWRFSILHRNVLAGAMILGVAIAILNNFVPISFDVSLSNVYERKYGFWLYIVLDYGILIDSIIIYLICRRRGGLLKSFPILIYFIPLTAGVLTQAFFYGISVISASIAVSIAGVFASLHSERVFRDKMTGAFNYTYLEYLSMQYAKQKNPEITGLMLNINEFRRVNRELGHATGNKILRKTATIMRKAIGELGIIARYSGDEFIAILNTQNEIAISVCITRIKSGISEYNKRHLNQKISFCLCTLDYDNSKGIDEFIDALSLAMQDEKLVYYSQNDNNRREK